MKKERKPFKEWGITKFVKEHGGNILETVAILPGVPNVVNVARKYLFKKPPMERVVDPIEATRLETNSTPEGKINKTKSVMIYMIGSVIINALFDRYLGFSFLPEEFIKMILVEIKEIFMDVVIDAIKEGLSGIFSK